MILLKSLIAAIQFLTILPLPVKTTERDLSWAAIWFPVVGAGLGALLGQLFHFLLELGNTQLAAALTLLIYIVLTRGLHLDGLMDTVDGFLSGKGRERIQAIMREPGVGSFAVLAAGTWFLALFSGVGRLAWLDLLVVHMLARYSILWLPPFFSYAGPKGTGRFFIEDSTKIQFVLGTLFTLALLFLAGPQYFKYLLISIVVSLAAGLWARRKICGVTGDVCGFVVEANHVVLIIVMAFISFKTG